MLELSANARHYFTHAQRIITADAPLVELVNFELASGEILQLHLVLNAQQVIASARYKAYGCAWLIACAELMCERLEGMSVRAAQQLSHNYLVEYLTVPAQKLHCAVMAETTLKMSLDSCSSGDKL